MKILIPRIGDIIILEKPHKIKLEFIHSSKIREFVRGNNKELPVGTRLKVSGMIFGKGASPNDSIQFELLSIPELNLTKTELSKESIRFLLTEINGIMEAELQIGIDSVKQVYWSRFSYSLKTQEVHGSSYATTINDKIVAPERIYCYINSEKAFYCVREGMLRYMSKKPTYTGSSYVKFCFKSEVTYKVYDLDDNFLFECGSEPTVYKKVKEIIEAKSKGELIDLSNKINSK